MAFTFRSPTLSGHIDEGETILFDMVRVLGLELPLLGALERDFYDNPRIPRNQVAALRDEALQAMRAFVRGRVLVRRRPWHRAGRDAIMNRAG